MSSSEVHVIEVFHLPSAASFYAAICQPLGIYYLSATLGSFSKSAPRRPPSLHFGLPSSTRHKQGITFFTLTESSNPQRSILTIDAFSSRSVTAFHARALAANITRSTNLISHTPEESIAKTTDLDGNMVEAKFDARRSVGGRGIWETAATPKEARRVLDWQKDVARSVSASDPGVDEDVRSVVSARSPARRGSDPPKLLRRETISTYQYQPREPARAERLVSGLSNQALIGTLLGAAAGATVAYAMVKGKEPRERDHELEADALKDRSRAPVAREVPRFVNYYSAHLETVEIEPAMSRRGGSEVGSHRSGRIEHVARYHVRGEAELAGIDEERSVEHRSRVGGERAERKSNTGSVLSKHSGSSKSYRDRDLSALPPLPESRVRSRTAGERSVKSSITVRSEASTVRPPKTRSHVTASMSSKSRSGEREERRSIVSAQMVPFPEGVVENSISRRSVAQTVAPSDSISNVGSRRDIERRWL